MPAFSLQQFVPSHVCLQCEGCCRFQSADSKWRPKWDKKEFIDESGYVKTIVDCGRHLCRFFNPTDSTCRTYHDRPFECELYPFLLSKEPEGVRILLHLACPFVMTHQNDPSLSAYIDYLRLLFGQPEVLEYLKRHPGLFQDYRFAADETLPLLTLSDLKV